MAEELKDCESCEGRGWKDDYYGLKLCFVCDGCGYELTPEQDAMRKIVERMLAARSYVKARAFTR